MAGNAANANVSEDLMMADGKRKRKGEIEQEESMLKTSALGSKDERADDKTRTYFRECYKYGSLKFWLFVVATKGGWREEVGPISASGTLR